MHRTECFVRSMQNGEVARTLDGDTEPVTALCWDTASRTLWVASRSLTVRSRINFQLSEANVLSIEDFYNKEHQSMWHPQMCQKILMLRGITICALQLYC